MKLEEIQMRFSADKYAVKLTGCKIDNASEHYAKCSLVLNENHYNAVGGVMGGVMFTLADFAFAVASNGDGAPIVSLSSQITYLGAVKGSILYAEAKCIKNGRSTCFYVIDITDNMGVHAASVSITGFNKGQKN